MLKKDADTAEFIQKASSPVIRYVCRQVKKKPTGGVS
jgi:hypothetical protein